MRGSTITFDTFQLCAQAFGYGRHDPHSQASSLWGLAFGNTGSVIADGDTISGVRFVQIDRDFACRTVGERIFRRIADKFVYDDTNINSIIG